MQILVQKLLERFHLQGNRLQLNHARNDLDALIVNTEIKVFWIGKRKPNWMGVKYTRESIRDRVQREVIDLKGFSQLPILDFEKWSTLFAHTGTSDSYQNIQYELTTPIDFVMSEFEIFDWPRKCGTMLALVA
jgi:hypothetical protein